MDTDESGEIDEQELSLALSNMGEEVTRNRLRELMVAVDTDGSGTIDFQEFLGVRRRAAPHIVHLAIAHRARRECR